MKSTTPKNVLAFAAALAITLASASNANAAITYIFSGTASGSLGGSAFTDKSFTLELEGDLGALYTGPNIIGVPALSASISIDGGSPISITDSLVAYVNTGNDQAGFYDNNLGGFNNLDLVVPGSGLNSYNMTTDFGPVSATPLQISYFIPAPGINTSSGYLLWSIVTAPASFQAVTSGVPDATSTGAAALLSIATTLAFSRWATRRSAA